MEHQPSFTLEAHPAERDRRPTSVTLCCGCSCCCCCIHSIGSLIGAAVASGPTYDRSSGERRPSAGLYYWLILIPVAGILAAIAAEGNGHTVGLIIVALGLPFVQLGVSLFLALCCLALADPATRPGYLWSVLRITLYTVGGGLLGAGLMIAGSAGMGYLK